MYKWQILLFDVEQENIASRMRYKAGSRGNYRLGTVVSGPFLPLHLNC